MMIPSRLRKGCINMPDYRAYIVDRDGYAQKTIAFDCLDDEVAIESAMQLVNGHDVELWTRGRQIIKLDSGDPE
jgi:hypothetical protein